MTTIRVLNLTRGAVLGTRVRLADQLAGRMRGFLFRPPPAKGEGILLSPCKAVHMFGVGFPLDVIFISEQGVVVATYPRLAPWRRSKLHGSALHALELPAGTIRATGTAVGDDLSWTATSAAAEFEEAGPTAEPQPVSRPVLAAPPLTTGTEAGTDAAATTDADSEATPALPADSDRKPTRRHA